MASARNRVTSGVSQLDKLLGGLYIGDNVVLHDDAGSLASKFCMSFVGASMAEQKPLIYVSFDRSPKNLLKKLGPLAESPHFILLDCFTYGKGDGSEVFLKFYDKKSDWPCQVIRVDDPGDVKAVMDAFYGIQESRSCDVRLIFESLTGMADLWNGEESLLKFYTHSCPRLYELSTIAYWVIEKRAHSARLKAHINQVAQVAIDLSVKRGKTRLTILKAENRNLDTLNKAFAYWTKDLPDHTHKVIFDFEKRSPARIDLGMRLKELRSRRGLSQTELARMVGVTPSNISQVESNLIYPSLPALIKMAEILSVEVSAFFQESEEIRNQVVFPSGDATEVQFSDLPKGAVTARRLTPIDFDPKAEPHIIDIPSGGRINSHFFVYKGEEMGYLLAGRLQMKLEQAVYTIAAGDVIYLTADMPTQWHNPGPESARLLWIKIR